MTARRGKILLPLALIVAFLAIALAAREYRKNHLLEPERCALCGREYVCHAPALLNLATGEIASLEIYAFNPFLPDEIDKTRTGFMQLKTGVGVQVCMDAGHSASVILPDKVEPMDYSLYCRSCRALLSEAGTSGYVIVDLHNPDTLAAYPTRLGTECFINGYRATVEKKTITAIPEGQVKKIGVLVTAAK